MCGTPGGWTPSLGRRGRGIRPETHLDRLCERTLGSGRSCRWSGSGPSESTGWPRVRALQGRAAADPLVGGDPDELLDWLLPRLGFFFTPAFLKISVALFALYSVILAAKWKDFAATVYDFYSLEVGVTAYAVFWLSGTVIIVIHELGHGLTCKYFGGQVHEIGAMLIYFQPAFYCNVNDAWTFPELPGPTVGHRRRLLDSARHRQHRRGRLVGGDPGNAGVRTSRSPPCSPVELRPCS